MGEVTLFKKKSKINQSYCTLIKSDTMERLNESLSIGFRIQISFQFGEKVLKNR